MGADGRLGAGFAISARNLDLRGAGELIGEEQVGHMKLVGVELYQDLLQRTLVEFCDEVFDFASSSRAPRGRVGAARLPAPVWSRGRSAGALARLARSCRMVGIAKPAGTVPARSWRATVEICSPAQE
jgi:hypothetical protein